MKIKSAIILAILAMMPTLITCSRDAENQPMHQSRMQRLYSGIDSINVCFLQSQDNDSVFIHQPFKAANEDNTSLKNEETQSIVTADAIGFLSGATLGAETGAVIGSLLGIEGSLAGGVIDALASGIATAITCSVVAANGGDSTQNIGLYYDIKNMGCLKNEIMFDKRIMGGNIGWYHNEVIREMLKKPIKFCDTFYVLDYATFYLESNKICEFKNRKVFCENLYKNWDILSTKEMVRKEVNPEYLCLIEKYIDVFNQIAPNKRFDYTQSVMQEISQFELKEHEIYLLNGTISTFYYSSILWNIRKINDSTYCK